MFNGNINHKLDYVVENGVNCLKKSFDNSNEQQLKLKREICFYQYCEKLDLKSVPKLISYDEKSIIIQFGVWGITQVFMEFSPSSQNNFFSNG